MKRSTAMGRLGDVADGLDRAVQWSEVTVVGGYVFGALLEPDAEIERIELALVVAEPPEVVPWMARPARLEALAELLRLPKLPVSWWWRPVDWPVWNHTISRAVRFWSADGGREQQAFDGLASGRLENVAVDAPANRGELIAQVSVERDVARRHLVTVTESFYDRDWRRACRGGDYPERALLRWTQIGHDGGARPGSPRGQTHHRRLYRRGQSAHLASHHGPNDAAPP